MHRNGLLIGGSKLVGHSQSSLRRPACPCGRCTASNGGAPRYCPSPATLRLLAGPLGLNAATVEYLANVGPDEFDLDDLEALAGPADTPTAANTPPPDPAIQAAVSALREELRPELESLREFIRAFGMLSQDATRAATVALGDMPPPSPGVPPSSVRDALGISGGVPQ